MTKKKFRGVVKWFDDKKGYGFITSIKPIEVEVEQEELESYKENNTELQEWESDDIFCYYKSILSGNNETSDTKNQFKTLKENDPVEFVIRDQNGRPQAVDIIVIKDDNLN
ncbi:MAG: cold shock domain-containing protein [Vigna little leaf phytoplasma]|nr:cold shock domain-containing protein [Vigna little leaf phytoplasma]